MQLKNCLPKSAPALWMVCRTGRRPQWHTSSSSSTSTSFSGCNGALRSFHLEVAYWRQWRLAPICKPQHMAGEGMVQLQQQVGAMLTPCKELSLERVPWQEWLVFWRYAERVGVCLTVAGATSVMTTAEEECGGGMEDKSGLASLGIESKLSGNIF